MEKVRVNLISFLDGDDLVELLFIAFALRILAKYPRIGGVAAWPLFLAMDFHMASGTHRKRNSPFFSLKTSDRFVRNKNRTLRAISGDMMFVNVTIMKTGSCPFGCWLPDGPSLPSPSPGKVPHSMRFTLPNHDLSSNQ